MSLILVLESSVRQEGVSILISLFAGESHRSIEQFESKTDDVGYQSKDQC
jgi:hypothetical protein